MVEKQVITQLAKGLPIIDMEIVGVLNLRDLAVSDNILSPVIFRRCQLEAIEAKFCQFNLPIFLEEVEVRLDSSFYACYFVAGLRITNCHFYGSLDFQSGGHNKNGHEFRLERSQFDGFVNFFDCWFEGPVVINQCNYLFGTNLLGNKDQPFEVTFDQEPLIENTIGDLNLSGG